MPDYVENNSCKPHITVIDLDGTLVKTNSFHRWLFFCLRHYILTGAILPTIKLLHLTLLRAFKYLSHEKWKRRILKLTGSISNEKVKEFVNALDKYTNYDILSAISHNQPSERYLYILCTAAPSVYAIPYASLVGIYNVVATPMSVDSDRWIENARDRKPIALANHLSADAEKITIDVLYTDHFDDLPLMRKAKRIELVNPSEETVERIDAESLGSVININRYNN